MPGWQLRNPNPHQGGSNYDIATDTRNEKLVMGLFASHANRISNLVASRAVSDNSYDAILGGDFAQTMEANCNSSNKDSLSVSFAVFGEMSGLKYLCEYGQSKNISDHEYLNGIFEEKGQDLIAKVNDVTRDGFVPAGEFIHEQGYFEFHNLPYLYVVAAMVPETDTAHITKENHYYLALHNLRGKFRQISADFLPIQHRGDKKADLRQKNEFTTVISVGEESGVKIGWPRSESYRDQFVTLVPIILSGIVLFTLVLWRNISNISYLHNELARREEQARFSASHDGMTGLINRQCFEAKVYFMLEENLGSQAVYVGLLDLDKFKSVNDTYGHQTGDELIKATASRLAEVMGPDNLAARLGGDEFSFAFTETSQDAALIRIQHLSEKLKEMVEFQGTVLHPSASIGVCRAVAGIENRETLLNLADRALYEVKHAGRGGYRFHKQEPLPKADTKVPELV